MNTPTFFWRALPLIAAFMVVAPSASTAGWQTFAQGEGLSATSVTAVYQDREGNLWFGSSVGTVTRYDGISWTSYRLYDNFTTVTAILERRDGTIWIATSRGAFRLDGGSFIAPPGLELAGSWTCLLEDREGFLWLGSNDAIGRYDGATLRAYWTFTGLPDNSITDLALDRDGVLYAATLGGVARFNGISWETVAGGGPPEGKAILRIVFDRAGALWVAFRDTRYDYQVTMGGVARWDGASWRTYSVTNGFPSARVSEIAFDREGRPWAATYDAGVATLEGDSWRRFGPADGLASFTANDLMVDRHGAVWVGTDQGANRFDGEVWTRPSATNQWPLVRVNSIAQAVDGPVWFGTDSSGVYRSRTGSLDHFGAGGPLGFDFVRDVRATSDGSVWFQGGGPLTRFLNGSWSSYARPLPMRLASDPSGRLIVGGSGSYSDSLWIHDPSLGFSLLVPLKNFIDLLFVDHQGAAWLTYTNGYTQTAFRIPPGGSRDSVAFLGPEVPRAFGEDADGRVWILTQHGALFQESGLWHLLTKSDGLLEDSVLSIEPDQRGGTWLGFPHGVARLSSGRWTYYNSPALFDSSGHRPILAAKDGSVYVGSDRGWLRYEPDRVAPHAVVLPPALPRVSPNPTQALAFAGAFREVNGLEFSTSLDSGPWSPWSGSALWVGAGLPDGVHDVRIRARDSESNVDSFPSQVTFEIDATPPAPVISSPTFGGSVRGTATIEGVAADARFLSYHLEVSASGGAGPRTTIVTSSQPVNGGPLATWDTTPFPDGDYDLRLSVTDSLGLVGTAIVSVVVDNQFPRVEQTTPATITAEGGDMYTTNRELHLYFPPGSFPQGSLVSIATTRGASDTLGSGAVQVSPEFRVAWAAPLEKDALIEFPASGLASPEQAAIYRSTDGTSWSRAGGTLDRDVISMATSLSGRYALFSGAPPDAVGGSNVSALSLTPRVFSPTGTYAAEQLAIGFTLGRAAPVTVRIYNRAGRLVREITSGIEMPPGANLVRWDGRDRGGVDAADGIYVVTVQAMGTTRRSTLAVVR